MNDDETTPEFSPALAARLRDAAVWSEPPADLEADVLTALRAARAEQAESPVTAVTPDGTDAPRDELTRARERRTQRRLSPRVLLAAASVVMVALVAVGGVLVLRDTGQEPSVVAMKGTELAPDANGEATISPSPSGFEIQLDISGLAPAPEGAYYQGWLKSPTDAVTIGTFHAREGSNDIILWSGVDPSTFPLLTVTLQQLGGGPESSGRVVLSAELP